MTGGYITYVGWNALPYVQGSFRLDMRLLNKKVTEMNAYRDGNMSITPNPVNADYILSKMYPRNIYSLIPVANIFCGLSSIFTALFSSDDDLLVVREQVLACRILLFTVGVLEITWIGAVAIHGIASLYFTVDQMVNHSHVYSNA